MQTQLYFNTTLEPFVSDFEQKAESQNEAVLALFRQGGTFTACEVHQILISRGIMHRNTPLTSCRRSITTLLHEGHLVNTGEKRIGIYGRNNFVWKLAA